MNSRNRYNAIGKVDDDILQQSKAAKKKNGWLKWVAMAACLCLAIGAFLWLKGPQTEATEIRSLDGIISSDGGALWAERLVVSGAATTNVRLNYVEGGDASNPAGAYAVTQYGDTEVAICREERDGNGSKPFLYRAEFTLDGVICNLSIHSDDPKDIYTCLDIILGESENRENQSGATLTNALGFDVCRVEMEELGFSQYRWTYYVKMNGEDVCVAEQFGYNGPETWSRDLDGDGVPELICNCTFGDGAQHIIVYRNHDGVIEKGNIRQSYYEEKFGWTRLGEGGIPSLPVEAYDPERGVFTATNYYPKYDDPVAVEFDDGLEPFEFLPFIYLP